MQLTVGPYVGQIWSRNTPESGLDETFVLPRVDGVLVGCDKGRFLCELAWAACHVRLDPL